MFFEMYLKVSGARVLLQLTEMPKSDKVDLSPAKGMTPIITVLKI